MFRVNMVFIILDPFVELSQSLAGLEAFLYRRYIDFTEFVLINGFGYFTGLPVVGGAFN